MALPDNPITRKETYLAKIAGQEVQIPDVPITREEAYLNQIAKEGTGTKVIANPDDVAEDVLNKVEIDGEIYSIPSGGGGGGSDDYLDLNNLPQVNGVELKGNKSTSDLGIKFDDLPDKPTLGTASAKNVPASGDASSSQVVMGNDSRLTDSRPASDVSSWAKQSTKPTYTASEVGAIATTQKGVASGVAELDANGKVPSSQLPSYVDDVIEGYYDTTTDRFYTESTFENVIPPESGKSWVDVASNKSYRWTGTVYSRVDEGVQLGETSGSAYRGDRGKVAYDHSQTTGNPHGTTFSDLINKPENANTFQGTIAEWNALSTAEKKAYDHASIPDSLDGNVTFPASKVMLNSGDSVEEKIGNVRMTKLWENPSPTADFAGQTIQMDLSEYDLILVTVCNNSGTSAVIPKGKSSQLVYLSATSTAPAYGVIGEWRVVTFSNNGVIFSNNSQMYTGGTISTVNSFNVPYQIYGITLT